MTFIASVKAKDGVAVIADSLVTSRVASLDLDAFLAYMQAKSDAMANEEVSFTQNELLDLFEFRTSHTQDYEQKLFQYDRYTAITTAGNAVINEKRIEAIITEAKTLLQKDLRSYEIQTLDERVDNLVSHLDFEVRHHVDKVKKIGATTFIVTYFEPASKQTSIYKIEVKQATTLEHAQPEFEAVSFSKLPDHFAVVCDGQNRISERILYGEFYDIGTWSEILASIISTVLTDFGIDANEIPENYVEEKTSLHNINRHATFSDFNLSKLKMLSLQQAVDLAGLLMRIEIDFQKYTKPIPTVGGVIKMAVIDINGFRFLSGNQISTPPHITYS